MVDFNQFTHKTQLALQSAHELASNLKHTEIDTVHYLKALVEQSEGVAAPMLEKAGVVLSELHTVLDSKLSSKAKYSAESKEPSSSMQLAEVLRTAVSKTAKLKDDFVSVEHVLLAIADKTELLKPFQLDEKKLLEAIQEVRGSARVTSKDPEGQYQALEKYARNLSQDARRGRLDPVIGRDDEIRRVIQVLSRRTKNNPVLVGSPGVGKTAIAEGLAQRIVCLLYTSPSPRD